MVTKIISGKSIRGLLNYNESKVTTGQAHLIMASRFGADLERLDSDAKLRRFEHLTSLNSRVKTNALHIMLNFDREDKVDLSTFQQIAGMYMDKIGFGEQPYLVYQHQDVSHPHLHIVTTNIRVDGNRIDIHNIGRTLSETARKEIETEFKLIKAKGRNKSEALNINPINIQKVIYGKAPTKRAINNIVSAVMQTYKFTSFAEYNTILKQFNVQADRGKEDTLMFEKRGLVYSIIDNEGKRTGIPFKASLLTGRPTLDRVEKKFEQNKEKRQPYKENLKESIEKIWNNYGSISKATLIKELQSQQIAIVFKQNESGFIYGATFIDHKNKTVFDGSSLGKAFSAKALIERLGNADKLITPSKQLYLKPPSASKYLKKESQEHTYLNLPEPTRFLETLLTKPATDYPHHILKKKRKKKSKNQQQDQELTL